MTGKVDLTPQEWSCIQRDVNAIRNAIVSNSQPWQLAEGQEGQMVQNRDALLAKIAKLLEPSLGDGKPKEG